MTRKNRPNACKLSRREFLARSAAAGVARSMPAVLAGSASIGAAAAADPSVDSIPLDRGWRMLQFANGDNGLLLSDLNSSAFGAAQPATVPGTVLTSLVNNGTVADPYFGTNWDRIPDAGVPPSWMNPPPSGSVGLYTYWFLQRFQLRRPSSSDARVFLVFRGINYQADAYLNLGAVATNASTAPYPQLEGAFLRYRLDVTNFISPLGINALAVKVTPPLPGNPTLNLPSGDGNTYASSCQPALPPADHVVGQSVTAQFSGGWDFVNSVADRDAGIWDDVSLVVTGPVVIGGTDGSFTDPQITTPTINGPAAQPTSATVLAVVEVRNTSANTVMVELQFEVGGQAGKSVSMPFVGGQVSTMQATVVLRRPSVWWPNGHGSQTLYPAVVRILAGGVLSDSYQCQIGVRTITSAVPLGGKGRVFTVNGQNIFVRGGNWTFPDAMLRHSPQNYDDQVRMHQLANLNLIRVWGGGIIERPEFYEACDRYGLLVWQEFPFTEDCKASAQSSNMGYNPADFGKFVACCKDAILMLRNHASLALWVGGNEINPPGGPWPDVPNPPGLNGMLQSLVATYDSKTAYVSSSFDGGLGKSSQIPPGLGYGDSPYDIKEPYRFFQQPTDYLQHNIFAFNPEYGSVGFPVFESLCRYMSEDDYTDLGHVLISQCDFNDGKLNRSWYLHHFRPFFSGPPSPLSCSDPNLTTPDQLLLYGSPLPNDTEAFCEQAQAAQYQQYKALFEGLNARMWTSYTGGNLWRSSCGYPGLQGFLYDPFLEPTAGLFGARIAGAPINVQINLRASSPTGVDYEVAVVNNTAAPLPDKLRIVVQFCDMNGKRRKDLDKALLITPVPANKVQAFDLQVASVLNGMPLVVARTILTTRSGGVLAKNLDWIAGTAAANPYPYAPLRALTHVNLNASGKGQYDRSSGCSEVTITIKNPTDTLAFFNRIRVWDPNPPGSGCPCPTLLSPVFLSDNYFSLLPGETTTVTLSFQFQGNRKPAIALTGWNSNPGTPDDIVPIRWR